MDKNEAVKTGELERNSKAVKVVRSELNKAIFPKASENRWMSECCAHTANVVFWPAVSLCLQFR